MVQVGQSIVEPHLDGRFAVVADGKPGPVAGYVHGRMLGRVGEGELHRARNRAFGTERCTGWAANLECHSFNPSDLPLVIPRELEVEALVSHADGNPSELAQESSHARSAQRARS